MQNRNRILFYMIFAFTALIVLLLNLLTPLFADDYVNFFRFDNGRRIQTLADVFPSVVGHMNTLNGRLVPAFLIMSLLLLPKLVFSLLNTAMYLLFILGLYRLALPEQPYRWKLLAILSGAVFLLSPTFAQTYLWMAGALCYLWCLVPLVYLLRPYANAVLGRGRAPGIAAQALMGLGALLFGNFSENISAAGALMMGFCIATLLWRRKRVPLWMWTTLLMTVAGWAVILLSPASQTAITDANGGLASVFGHFKLTYTVWMEKGLWLCVGWVVLFCAARATSAVSRERIQFSAGLFICAQLCNLAMTAANHYPDRAFTGTVVFLIAAYGALLAAIPRQPSGNVLVSALALSLTAVSLFTAAAVLPDTYSRYALAQGRAQAVAAARDAGQTDVVTFGITGHTPYDVFYDMHGLTDQKDFFCNVYYAKYFGLSSIVTGYFEK